MKTEHGLEPLVWVERPKGWWAAFVPLGAYRLYERADGRWAWTLYSGDDYAEASGNAGSIEDAKKVCTEDYVERFACVVRKGTPQ